MSNTVNLPDRTDPPMKGFHPTNVSYWIKCIQKWYPELDERTYFLPPLQFKRVAYDAESVAGQSLLVPRVAHGGANQTVPSKVRGTTTQQGFPPQRPGNSILPVSVLDSDVRDDRAQECVLQCLRVLAENSNPKEVMMVVSQLKFGQYLNKTSYAAAAAASAAFLPRPTTLPPQYRQGDFDVLIIHKQHGLIIGEIKSVGENFSNLNLGEKTQNTIVVGKVSEAIKQLDKAEHVLKHIVSDIQNVKITKTLMMPFLTSDRLLQAINTNPQVVQNLCRCLDVRDTTTAIQLCLCANHVPPKNFDSDDPSRVLAELREWWCHLVTLHESQTADVSQYQHIVARFCGPATTVDIFSVYPPRLELRTEGEAVSETGERMARLVLFPEQIDILNQSPRRLFIVGPPGTGKTVVLILHGLQWLQQRHELIVILSTWVESHATAYLIEHQLSQTMKGWPGQFHKFALSIHQYAFNLKHGLIEDAVTNISQQVQANEFLILADDVGPEHGINQYFSQFCDRLIESFPTVNLWATATSHLIKPSCLPEFIMTTPVRSPPVVVREVEKAQEFKAGFVHPYTFSQLPVETDGPPIIRISHRGGHLGHSMTITEECEKCGVEVAGVLKQLDVGRSASVTEEYENPEMVVDSAFNMFPVGNRDASKRPPPLKFCDVIVLCSHPRDDGIGINDHVTTAIGIVRGLRACDIPVCVVGLGADITQINDMARQKKDAVIVTSRSRVHGLERKVVVMSCFDMNFWYDTLHGASRCQAQLVWIESC